MSKGNIPGRPPSHVGLPKDFRTTVACPCGGLTTGMSGTCSALLHDAQVLICYNIKGSVEAPIIRFQIALADNLQPIGCHRLSTNALLFQGSHLGIILMLCPAACRTSMLALVRVICNADANAGA